MRLYVQHGEQLYNMLIGGKCIVNSIVFTLAFYSWHSGCREELHHAECKVSLVAPRVASATAEKEMVHY
jgi:hypothetical protein